jgi:type I restriction enzyme R subunit
MGEHWDEQWESQTVKVTSNASWIVSILGAESWLKVDRANGVGNGEFTVSCRSFTTDVSGKQAVIMVVAGNKTSYLFISQAVEGYSEDKLTVTTLYSMSVFDNYANSLRFDEESVKTVIKNIDEIKANIPQWVQDCLDFFPGVDRTIGGFQGLEEAQERLKDEKVKMQFGAHYQRLHKAWEVVSPDADILPYKSDYIWLSQVYESVRPVTTTGNLIWTILGPKTIELIHENVTSIDIGESIEDLVVNSRILDECVKDEGKRNRTIIEIQKMLKLRLGNPKHSGSKEFKKLSEKLRELQEKLRQKLIDSIQFLKDLLALARETLEVEQKLEQPQDKRQQARAALTELFESIKTPETPIVVENVVNDIDSQVVSIVRRFNNAFKIVTGQNEIRKMLRTILWLKYKIKDNEVFEKAYKYVEMYYTPDVTGPRPGAKTIYIDAETNETSSTMAAESAKPYGEE